MEHTDKYNLIFEESYSIMDPSAVSYFHLTVVTFLSHDGMICVCIIRG